jgi:hypothetical protein
MDEQHLHEARNAIDFIVPTHVFHLIQEEEGLLIFAGLNICAEFIEFFHMAHTPENVSSLVEHALTIGYALCFPMASRERMHNELTAMRPHDRKTLAGVS